MKFKCNNCSCKWELDNEDAEKVIATLEECPMCEIKEKEGK